MDDLLKKDVLLGLAILFSPVAVAAFEKDWKIGSVAILLVVMLVGVRTFLKSQTIKKP